jgi:N-methylhydantoinase A
LQVGPESAGSVPGPVCYGRGNTRPTLTDAQVVLGRINAARPLGGELKSLDVQAARQAIATHVGKPLGLDADAAAVAIVRVAEARMAGAIRLVSIERGHDPGRFVAMPFGGGGALHVGALIRQIGLKCALVPRFPGLTSALGCVLADLRHDVVQTLNLMLDGLDAAALERRMRAAGKEASAVVAACRIPIERTDMRYELDMHYLGQTHTVSVPLPVTQQDDALGVTESLVRQAFETAYLASFSRLLPKIPARIVTLRVAAIGRRPAFDFSVFAPNPSATLDKARLGSRPVWFDGGWRDTPIWARLDLPAGAAIGGPVILEQPDATTVIEPGLAGRIDSIGNLIVEAAA